MKYIFSGKFADCPQSLLISMIKINILLFEFSISRLLGIIVKFRPILEEI